MNRSLVAPCQCHSLGSVMTMSPERSRMRGPPAGLDEAFACGAVEGLAAAVAVPSGVRARREVHASEGDRRVASAAGDGVDVHVAGEPVG